MLQFSFIIPYEYYFMKIQVLNGFIQNILKFNEYQYHYF